MRRLNLEGWAGVLIIPDPEKGKINRFCSPAF